MKRRRVLVLMQPDCEPPANAVAAPVGRIPPWKTEFDVISALRSLGHQTRNVVVGDDLAPLRTAIDDWKPDVVFVLLEEFRGRPAYVPYVVGYLELVGQPYTGCCPDGLVLAHDKALQKRILRQHQVPAPDFVVVPRGQAARRPVGLAFPLMVKSTTVHGSVGISQASVVHDEARLSQQVRAVHEALRTDALVEEYVEGRELYVGVVGNRRLRTLPIWELTFANLPAGSAAIATERAKWSLFYQREVGLATGAAEALSDEQRREIRRLCRRAYRALRFSGYARVDLRMRADGRLSFLECNPNPNIGFGDDFADSADAAGIPYVELIDRVVRLGLRRGAEVAAGSR